MSSIAISDCGVACWPCLFRSRDKLRPSGATTSVAEIRINELQNLDEIAIRTRGGEIRWVSRDMYEAMQMAPTEDEARVLGVKYPAPDAFWEGD